MKLVRVHAAPQLGLVLGVSSRFVARQSVPRRRRDGSRWCRASDIALWRRACEHSPAPLRALPARTPCERYLNLSSKPAGGSQLPPPPPPRRGRSSAIIACITVQSVPGTLEAQNQPIRDQLATVWYQRLHWAFQFEPYRRYRHAPGHARSHRSRREHHARAARVQQVPECLQARTRARVGTTRSSRASLSSREALL